MPCSGCLSAVDLTRTATRMHTFSSQLPDLHVRISQESRKPEVNNLHDTGIRNTGIVIEGKAKNRQQLTGLGTGKVRQRAEEEQAGAGGV